MFLDEQVLSQFDGLLLLLRETLVQVLMQQNRIEDSDSHHGSTQVILMVRMHTLKCTNRYLLKVWNIHELHVDMLKILRQHNLLYLSNIQFIDVGSIPLKHYHHQAC